MGRDLKTRKKFDTFEQRASTITLHGLYVLVTAKETVTYISKLALSM